jgi:hypothetical protein
MKARRVIAGLMFLLPAASSAQYPSGPDRALVVSASAAYIASALFGAHVAIRDTLRERPFGIRFPMSVKSDFLVGGGTALSPSLPMLLVQAAVVGMTAGPTSTSRKATHALGVGGVLYFGGQLCEPITWRLFRHPSSAPRDRLLVTATNIIIPALMTAASIRALR